MTKSVRTFMFVFVVMSFILAACGASQATEAPVVEPTTAPAEPTAATAEPTEAPPPKPQSKTHWRCMHLTPFQVISSPLVLPPFSRFLSA